MLMMLTCFLCQQTFASDDQLTAIRNRLVDRDIVAAGIQHAQVIAAMRRTPRHEFVPITQRGKSYFDMALPIGGGQTISPPYVVAYMTEQLNPLPTDKVLEIGTGSGYQAAVLSNIVDQVYTIEIVESLGHRAARTLRQLGYHNVHTRIGDGYLGWPEHAPFHKIIVTCSPENIPQPLIDQLADGGQMIVPVGERFQQSLFHFTKHEGKLQKKHLQSTFFVPMTGEAESRRQVKPDSSRPILVHGSFEQTIDDSRNPQGWYYIRQGRVTDDSTAPDGLRCMVFTNVTPGRNSHAMQAFGIDGRRIRQIEISFWTRGVNMKHGRSLAEQGGFIIEYYGKNRAPVGFKRQGGWQGTFDWSQKTIRLNVSPRTRLAVVGIGLLGATGEMRFDAMKIRVTARRQPHTEQDR